MKCLGIALLKISKSTSYYIYERTLKYLSVFISYKGYNWKNCERAFDKSNDRYRLNCI